MYSSFYSYDEMGRAEWIVIYHIGWYAKKLDIIMICREISHRRIYWIMTPGETIISIPHTLMIWLEE